LPTAFLSHFPSNPITFPDPVTSRVSSADPASQPVIDRIAPDDGMWGGNPSHYFGVGQSALHCIKVSMLAAGIETFTNILDLPCGHGRVLRHLQHAFPGAQLTACDINMPATEFCARTFGATPVQGHESPGKIALQGNYDLIWVGSLLTHLDEKACTDFLDVFRAKLRPKGLLVLTLHGREVARRMRGGVQTYGLDSSAIDAVLKQYVEKNFAFQAYHPDQTAPGIEESYGISLASPCWVFSQVARMRDVRLLTYTENGWDNHHDVVSFLRE
jgi:SAM-dependent methyltransferase